MYEVLDCYQCIFMIQKEYTAYGMASHLDDDDPSIGGFAFPSHSNENCKLIPFIFSSEA